MSIKTKLPVVLTLILLTVFVIAGCVGGNLPDAQDAPTPIAILPTDAPTASPTVAPTEMPTPEPTATAVAQPAPISLADAANLAYTGIYTEAVQLTDGTFEGEPFVPGGASRPTVTLLPDFFAQGDLNGDGLADAAVLVVENSGGSGTFFYLAALINGTDGPVNGSTIMVGDRMGPNSLTIVDGLIVLDTIISGPNDPMCCPSLAVIQTYALEDGALAMISEEPVAAVPADALADTSWQLELIRQPDGTEQTPANPSDFTLAFEAGSMGGKADCNNVSAPYEVDETGGIVLGPMITTLAMCAPDSLYDAYTQALGQVTGYSFDQGKLILTFGDDGDGTLVFTSDQTRAASVESTLAGTTWQLQTIRQANGTEQTPADPSAYTLAFDAAGQIAVQADCNQGFAAFTAEAAGTLTFGPMGMTKAMCAPGSLFDAYSQALDLVTGYSLEGDTLTLTFGEESDGALVFIAQ